MTTPRRRIVRPAVTPAAQPQPDPRLAKLRSRLEVERTALNRWMTRLKRAFHAVERCQTRVARMEKTVARLEG